MQICRSLIKLALLASLAGCAAIGPLSSPDLPQLVGRAVPTEDGEIHYFGSGNWYPNTRGFTDVRSMMLTSITNPVPGVLVVTTSSIILQQWDESHQRFDIVKRLTFSELMDVVLDSYGVNRRLVVRKKDFSYDTFDFTKGSGALVDAKKVENACKFIQERR